MYIGVFSIADSPDTNKKSSITIFLAKLELNYGLQGFASTSTLHKSSIMMVDTALRQSRHIHTLIG